MKTLSIHALRFAYDGRALLNDLTADLAVGAYHLVLGRAGSGKTTLLMLLAGFLRPQAGEIRSDAQPWKPEGDVCLAFQNPEVLFFQPTVGEEIEYALLQRGMKSAEARPRAMDWARAWGIDAEAFWGRHPSRLSGGEKRRVALAACTVFQPSLLLLDEPTAGLDVSGRQSLKQRLVQLSREHVVVVVTHDPSELLSEAGSVLVLGEGKSNWYATAGEFLAAAWLDQEVYPLPEWYRRAVEMRPERGKTLPALSAHAVAAWVKGA